MNEEATTQNQTGQTDTATSDRSRMTSIFIGILLVLAAFLAYNFFQSDAGTNNGNNQNNNQQATNTSPTTQPTGNVTPGEGTPATPTEAIAANEYVVQQGDTLWSIAEKRLNDGFLWKEIAKANNISDSSQLKVGSKLVIPTTGENGDVAANQPTATPTTGQIAGANTTITPTPTQGNSNTDDGQETPATGGPQEGQSQTYTVQRGDTLWSIAERFYGDGGRWREILNLKENNISYLTAANGNSYPLIHSGNVLVIPNATR